MKPTILGYLEQDEVLSLSVVGSDPVQSQELLATLESCTAGRSNTYCCAVPMEEVSQAHSVGLSYGKYRLYLLAQELDPSLTPEQVQEMTMRELRDWLSAHSSGRDPWTGIGQGGGSGNQHGPSQGSGGGWGSGQGNGWQGGHHQNTQ